MRCSVLFCSVLMRSAALNLGARSAEKFEVVAVADKLETRRDQAQAELGCEVYDDWRKMLAGKEIEDLLARPEFRNARLAGVDEEGFVLGF